MGFGTKFRELRENRGISRAAADEVFGLMRGTWSNWENDYNMPEEELLPEIADYFGVRVKDLIGDAA